MLLKTSSSDKNSSFLMNNGKGKGKSRSFSSRIHRKTLRIASKPSGSSSTGKRVPIGKRISMGKNHRNIYAPFATSSSSLCDNSNDSGLGFDNHESQNTLHKTTTGSSSCNNNNNSQILTLTNNNNNNNNANYNNSSANYQRSLNTIRYGETTTQPSYISTSTRMHHEVAIGGKKQLTGLGAGKKIKSIINKPHSVTKCISSSLSSNHLTLKNESEDTCGDDFFSTHIQKNNAGSKISKTIAKNGSLSNGSRSSEKEQSSSPLTLSSSSSSSSEPASPEIASSNDDVQLSPDNSDGVYLVASPLVTSSSTDSFQNNNLIAASRNGRIQLQIITQPEQQHRARYQTEGSRGAVKDKSGNGFPVVKLNGYNKPTTLQVFIGNDVGRVSPHIFYQACKVSGKNSTPCNEVKIDGTMIIEIEIKPENDMTVVCDCVGILKERNVDVEHRLGKNNTLAASAVTRNKKKSTKCRMIFRTKINEDTDFPEILQICSNTITCTQPPGTPEICKKSLDSCNALGGKELFIIGKNFLKDTKVTFVQYDEIKPSKKIWEEIIQPDKEYLQQTHLICTVPALPNAEALTEPVHVQIYVTSSNKKSEPHNFIYLPLKKYQPITHSPTTIDLSNIVFTNGKNSQNVNSPPTAQLQSILSLNWSDGSATTTNPPLLPSLPARTRASSFSNFSRPRASSFTKKISQPSNDSKIALKTEIDFIEQPCSNVLQETTTTSSSINSSLQPTTSSVKDILYNDSTLLSAVSNGQCYVQPTSSTLIGPTEVEQVILNELVNTSNALDLQNIKSEQNAEIQTVAASAANVSTSMLPPIAPPPSVQQQSDLTVQQQQQQVENFLNMICAQVEAEPPIAPQTSDIMHHDLVSLSNPTTTSVVANSAANIQSDLAAVTAANMCAITTQTPMMCEQNLLQIDAVSTQTPMLCEQNLLQIDAVNILPIATLDTNIENSTSATENTSLISNAVSDATAETQAVVKQMIATVTEQLLSENPTETQSTITSFISSTLVNDMVQAVSTEQAQQNQQQITDSQQQQIQEIIAQELLTPVTMINKDDNNGQAQNIQSNIITVAAATNTTRTLNQPFSPTPDFNLTTMSESDLISFINPSVFM